jgi:ATP-dependent Clp protease ATP-binding subunit ClpX
LFICGGAFAGLDKIIEQRVGKRGVGFGAEIRTNSERADKDLFSHVLPEDLLKFGLIPEFVGRLPVLAVVDNLDRDALVNILVAPKNALVKQYQKFFELEDVELEFSEEALSAVADLALERGTGARGLRAILEDVLLSVMYELPSRTDVGKVVVGLETVTEKAQPELLPRAEKPKSQRQRRAAS